VSVGPVVKRLRSEWHRPHRKKMDPKVSSKAVFILNNYSLLHKEVDVGSGLDDFSGSLLVEEVVAEELQAKRLHLLRCGQIGRSLPTSDDDLLADEVDERAGATRGLQP